MEQTQKNEAILAHTRAGKATELVDALFDAGTFSEIGTCVRGECAAENGQPYESVITGYGAVDGRPVFAFVQDSDTLHGVMTAAHAAKICRLYELAMKSRAPIVGIFSGEGAAVTEGVSLLSSYGSLMNKVRQASLVIPQIAVIEGTCSGASAVLASMFDFKVINASTGSLFIGAPFLLREQDKTAGFGTPAFAEKTGAVSLSAESSFDAMTTVRRLLSYLPTDMAEGQVFSCSGDDINEPRSVDLSADIETVISQIVDAGTFMPLSQAYAPSMVTGLAVVNDRVIGVVANNRAEDEGKLHADGTLKAARFVALCNRMRIPVLTLTDTAGLAVTAEDEKAGIASALAELACAYASCKVPLITLLLGKAYGSAYTLMGSRALGADVVYAVETARIGTMSPDAAVELIKRDELLRGEDRAGLVEEYCETVMSPYAVADSGDIDRVVSIDEIRPRIAAALEILALKDRAV